MGFSLRKWYLDCVSDDGEAIVGYRAELRWEALALHYASILHQDGEDPPRVRSTLRRCPPPAEKSGEINWEAPPLELSGTWQALAPAFSTSLFEGHEGNVLWRCQQPRARAQVRLPSGRKVEGLGYVEELIVTVPPWHLPIEQLRWGRFASARGGLVWIEWRGPHPLRLALVDGKPVELGAAGEQLVEAGALSLHLSAPAVLRSGRLGGTALSVIPGVERIFPLRILGLEETKWRSRGTLGADPGWAIHEVVRWPR